jgi:hypothetical protein
MNIRFANFVAFVVAAGNTVAVAGNGARLEERVVR